MKNKCKKLISIVAAATLLGSVVSLAACTDDYSGTVSYTPSQAVAESNGGFVVKKDKYVYFINGKEDYTATNEYEVVKGALMRIDTTDMKKEAETVVPLIVGSQGFESGIFIYGDYVYYATPSTDENMEGEVANNWIDFKKSKLNGDTSSEYLFRLDNYQANYRFVQEKDGTVYCLYEEDGALKSFNTANNTTSVLVKNATSDFFFDSEDLTNPNVYYTMGVTYDIDSDNAQTAGYNQLYCVSAGATATVSEATASYTVKGGRTYTFDAAYMNEKNEEAEEDETDAIYDLADYSTYPYVNLGTLVLDGVGKTAEETQYNNKGEKANAKEPQGYTYAITSFVNNGIYLTKTENVKTSSEAEASKLYYFSDTRDGAWTNAVANNDKLTTIASDTTNASTSALYFEDGYVYLANDNLYRTNVSTNETVTIARGVSGATLWRIDGDYVYYYGTGTSGNNLSRVNYTGTQDNYNALLNNKEYQPVTFDYVDWMSSWYSPEIVDGYFYYPEAYTINGTAYNYVAAVQLPATQAEVTALNEKYEEVTDYMADCGSDMQKVLGYYFRTGETTVFDNAFDLKLYNEDEQEILNLFKQKETDDTNEDGSAVTLVSNSDKDFIIKLGSYSEADIELMNEGWAQVLRHEEETEEATEEGWPTWAIVLTSVGVGILAILIIVVPVVVVNNKKKARRKAEATVNAYKRKKIDTTDDKSIDVYADDEEEKSSNDESKE